MKRALLIWAMVLLVISCGTANRAATDNTVASGEQDEELLNTGYGHVKKRNYTGSISKIDVKTGSGYTDIYDYIRGRVPGVMVNGKNITIRGINSINSSTEPLILVDGVEVSDLSTISPEMVDRIDVLKDASSTSLYGIRGANGVILITLRKK